MKIVIVGAASLGFGRGAIAGFLAEKNLNTCDLEIALLDVDSEALDVMQQMACLIRDFYGSKAVITATTDRKEALIGADYVINAVAKKRMALWQEDFFVPMAFGFKHGMGENGGPGGTFHALRSIHLILPIAKDMEALCPNAYLLNYSNPESRVCFAIHRFTKIKTVGLCHGAFVTLEKIAEILGRPAEEIEITIGGINHFHWALKIEDLADGSDLYPMLHYKLASSDFGLEPFIRRMYDIFGLFPMPCANHVGEFVSFGAEMIGPHWLHTCGKDRSEFLMGDKSGQRWTYYDATLEDFKDVIHGRRELTEEFTAAPSTDVAVSIIRDIELNYAERLMSVNVPNDGHIVENLPEDCIVEVPACVDGDGLHPIHVGALPDGIASMCTLQIGVQDLLLQAYEQRSKKLLLQALLLDPVIDDINRAEKMMEELLRVEAPFLPEFK